MTQLSPALAARADTRQRWIHAAAALERGRQMLKDAESEAARLAGEEQRWIGRHAKKLEAWIAAGSHGTAPVLTVDAKAQAALSSARASAAAAAQALTGLAVAEATARQQLDVAKRRVSELKAAAHRARATELLEQMQEHLDAYVELRNELGATAAGRELYGIEADFGNVLTPEQVDMLNSPVLSGLPTLGDLFTPTLRPVVGQNVPLSGDPALLDKYLAPWRALDEALERGEAAEHGVIAA